MSDDHSDGGQAKGDGGDRSTNTLSEDIIDAICRALGDRHRRRILGYLIEAEDSTATLDELLDPLASISPHARARRRIAVHHNHLPVLHQAGIIEYDRRSKTVRYYGHRLAEDLLACTSVVSDYDYHQPAESSGG